MLITTRRCPANSLLSCDFSNQERSAAAMLRTPAAAASERSWHTTPRRPRTAAARRRAPSGAEWSERSPRPGRAARRAGPGRHARQITGATGMPSRRPTVSACQRTLARVWSRRYWLCHTSSSLLWWTCPVHCLESITNTPLGPMTRWSTLAEEPAWRGHARPHSRRGRGGPAPRRSRVHRGRRAARRGPARWIGTAAASRPVRPPPARPGWPGSWSSGLSSENRSARPRIRSYLAPYSVAHGQ